MKNLFFIKNSMFELITYINFFCNKLKNIKNKEKSIKNALSKQKIIL